MLGHSVYPAATAEEAILLDTAGLQVLLTDISLPHMSGVELSQHVRLSHPHIEIIYSSGHDRQSTLADDDPAKFLLKPFTVDQLLAVL